MRGFHLAKQETIHNLGYNLNAPLPYCLTDEDIFGRKFSIDKSKYDPADPNLETSLVLAHFLNNDVGLLRNSDTRPFIDEGRFVRTWLPFMYNDEPKEITVQGGKILVTVTDAWVRTVAGGPYNAVDILREGKLIFRVPPVLGRLNVVGGADRRKPIGLMYQDLEAQINRSPATKLQQVDEFTRHLFDPKDPDADRSEFMATPKLKYLYVMDEIFTYYGYNSILTPEIMKYKPYVMGIGAATHGTHTSGTVSGTPHIVEPYEDDDDLF